jgi:predicted nucleic acid-binding protein
MARNIADVRTHVFRPGDRYFLDANIWLDIHGPLAGKNPMAAAYSTALDNMTRQGSQIHLDVLVLSEFVNRFARLEYKRLRPGWPPSRFKEFRKSAAFKLVARDIALHARQILGMVLPCDSGFTSVDQPALLTRYEAGDHDLNDLIIAELCKARALTLVTHDADFRDSGLPILTANKALLD